MTAGKRPIYFLPIILGAISILLSFVFITMITMNDKKESQDQVILREEQEAELITKAAKYTSSYLYRFVPVTWSSSFKIQNVYVGDIGNLKDVIILDFELRGDNGLTSNYVALGDEEMYYYIEGDRENITLFEDAISNKNTIQLDCGKIRAEVDKMS
ncbi:MAG: hypothetical protein LBN22_06395 [Clostridiales Family XIII bacterium]|nr:hypothetical protein [Clostridiales Family XIII bacterium]